jgi:thioredoxin-like negative regulator of GroEL
MITSKRLAALMVVAVIGSLQVLTGLAADSIEWIRSYENGLKEARKSNRAILIDFWATWCGPCQRMDHEVWSQPQVVALSKKFVCVSVDVDRDSGTADRYQAHVLPKIVITDPWANALTMREGYVFAADMVKLLSAVPDDFAAIAKVQAAVKENKDDFEAWLSIARFYQQFGVLDLSERYLKSALKTTTGKNNPLERERVLVMLGLNNLKLNKAKEARKVFEQCLKEFGQSGGQCDRALLGLVTALASEGKFEDAEKVSAELQVRFPGSRAAEQATRNLEEARSQR